ncbi:PAS domain-containing sensor histidine kinase [Roseovarius sp. SCSIO 43702]|uniref:sensor histidine kinase n=1 Tax=Roseovarius sp. SCSIO 43702 TaxID=2823043 RepID=UPI001C739F96|nr:PAS domain-containing sensor histidine kinase [Roseovarius sp. SCSIO 43702]QYX56447.1 PAS domain-containing sensor histidine kinase [Roseovarius sp. SCSIO 43702]
MTRTGGSALWLALPLFAVAAFAVLLTSSLVRMTRLEADMRVEAEQNMLWVMHQSEAAARRLTETALLAELGEADAEDLALRFDILLSRIALLNAGPQRRFVEDIGVADELDRLTGRLEGIDPASTPPAELRAALASFPSFFARAANEAMIAEWDKLGGRLETYRDQMRKTIIALIGIMAAGAVLTIALVIALRKSRQRNRMLRQARNFSELLIASSGEGIAALNRAGRCTLWNEAMTGLVGRPAEQAVGRPLTEVAGFFDVALVREALARALAGESTQHRLQPLFRDGEDTPLHVDLRIFPMRSETGIVGAIVFLQDASDRHAAARRNAETRERLEYLVAERTRELNDALRRERSAADLYRNFATMMSHQFRTPLAIADSALQRLIRRGDRADPDEVADRATRARGAIAGLTRLVDSTLDAARIDVGQMSARRERCDLLALLHSVCDQQHAASPAARIRVCTQGDAVAICDPAHAEQVLKNLISNAVTYAAPGSEVSVCLDGDGEHVTCDVRNTGTDIDETERERIFERNFRGANSTGKPGTGVGLFIARTLARMQGGEVALLPGGNGTTFRLSLPRPEGDAA